MHRRLRGTFPPTVCPRSPCAALPCLLLGCPMPCLVPGPTAPQSVQLPLALPCRSPVAQELPLLSSMEQWFMPHYTRIAARKLLFFHGKRRARGGELRIR